MGYNGYNPMENRMARQIDSGGTFETNPTVRLAYEKAQKLFREHAIQPKNFGDLYDQKAIQADLAKVDHLKSNVFETGSGKIAADILEGIVFDQIELSNWFGSHAHTLKTSEFDDIVNGVDLIVEFDEPESRKAHLALGVDATYGADTISKKFGRIKRDIDQDRLATIKYFESGDGRIKGRLTQVPRIVLGVERGTVLSLARAWTEGRKGELAVHPVQELLLKQARSQLTVFAHYARMRGRHESRRSYDEALAIVNGISGEKGLTVSSESVREMLADKVHLEILEQLDTFR
ncbi:MAG: hypothetical protein AB199_03745 [Parcubacteria bacterium C7867-004]|nr:MAG: hypothetical protein AB199_03745 [Parcubacteria bacterium C7867-004]